jgi:hypothetical protein
MTSSPMKETYCTREYSARDSVSVLKTGMALIYLRLVHGTEVKRGKSYEHVN